MTGSRGGLFDPIFGADDVAHLLSDQAWVMAMLDVEAALSRAAARHGMVDAADATIVAEVASKLGRPGGVDIAVLGAASTAGGNPVIPLVKLLRDAVVVRGVPGSAVHPGATSQDILDTALMLMLKRVVVEVRDSLHVAAQSSAELAREHRSTAMAGRTLGQQALPTTFGAVAAGWAAGLVRADDALDRVMGSLAVQFGGAAGTLAASSPNGLAIADSLADELGLARQGVPWHTERTRIGAIAGAFGVVAGAVAKPALDITVLASTEVGEVAEAAPGGSSAMPHKRNPIAAITARGAVRRVPGLVAAVLSSMEHDHQRATGAWHAEWETLADLARSTAGGARRVADSLSGLKVNVDAMASNLQITGGLLLAERVTAALAPHTGAARDIVTAACASGVPLDEESSITKYLDPVHVRELLDPATYLGHAGDIVDRVLADVLTRYESQS